MLPLARQLLAGVWSPYSRRQSQAAAAMLADLLVYVPAEQEELQVRWGWVDGRGLTALVHPASASFQFSKFR